MIALVSVVFEVSVSLAAWPSVSMGVSRSVTPISYRGRAVHRGESRVTVALRTPRGKPVRDEQTAEENLELTLRAIRRIGGGQEELDAATARNVLHEELGYFKSKATSYSLDEATRDRLIVHGRQDASHAVMAAITAGKRVRKLERMVWVLIVAIVMLVVVQVWALSLR